ncbi:3,4-dihydroxy-2-butanone-4-phosphate synthase [Nocardia vinacea]|uniref:3,4-dihydroxy-2-butanone-4-phosphate synthase n=1 Tax=Nocardia vinacea TaxID=96468 RepID=A0ABZ1YM31_9NOCA|nr:3,4-dihydroxy-2-butanone-4-phosphate synthase [Nocardia vinacea]
MDDSVRHAIAAIAAGRPVVVVDESRDQGSVAFAASLATTPLVAFTVRHTSGFIRTALTADACDRLELPRMYHGGDSVSGACAYRVTVDLMGAGTGISGADRARTITALASPESSAADFSRPGHVVPVEVVAGGVLGRPWTAEAAVDLARLAGLPAAGTFCEVVSEERAVELARGEELARFAAEHELALVSIADLITHRRRNEPQVRRTTITPVPTEQGMVRVIGYESVHSGATHTCVVSGEVAGQYDVPVYIHTQHSSGGCCGSVACACDRDLHHAMNGIAAEGQGVVIHVRSPGPTQPCPTLSESDQSSTSAEAVAVLAELGVRSFRLT